MQQFASEQRPFRSNVSAEFWSHERPEEILTLLRRKLEAHGYLTPVNDTAGSADTFVATSSEHCSLFKPWRFSFTVRSQNDRSIFTLAIHSHPRYSKYVWPALIIHNLWMISGFASFALLPNSDILSNIAFTLMLLGLGMAILIYPVGLFPAARHARLLHDVAQEALADSAYAVHSISGAGENRPFGWRTHEIVLPIAFPVFLALTVLLLVFPLRLTWPLVPLLICLIGIGKTMLRKRQPVRPSAREYRHSVALAASFTYASVLLVGPLGLLASVANVSARADSTIALCSIVGVMFVGVVLVWGMVATQARGLSRIASDGEFREHVTLSASQKTLPRMVLGILLLTLVVESLSLLFVVCTFAPPDWPLLSGLRSTSLAAAMVTLPMSYKIAWSLSILCFLVLRTAGLLIFKRSSVNEQDRLVALQLPATIKKVAAQHRCLKGVTYWESQRAPSVAYCLSTGLLRPRYSIHVGSELIQASHESHLEALLAHELGHCLLQHDSRSRALRIIGLMLFLDPVILTAFIDHTRNEEQADARAIELLGNSANARQQMIDALRHFQSLMSDVLHAAMRPPVGVSLLPSSAPEEQHRRKSDGPLARSWIAFQTYLTATRVLYVHPSFDFRINRILASETLTQPRDPNI